MKKEYFSEHFNDESELVDFLNESANDVNVISITYNNYVDFYVLFYWCYEPKDE